MANQPTDFQPDERTRNLVAPSDDVVEPHLEARREVDPGQLGVAIPGQINVVDANGTVHNFVGQQSVPLTNIRDGGPYLDEVDAARLERRRDYVLAAPSTVGINDAPVIKDSPSVATERDDSIARDQAAPGAPAFTSTHSDDGLNPGGTEEPDDVDNVDNDDDDDELLQEPTDEELFGTTSVDESEEDVNTDDDHRNDSAK